MNQPDILMQLMTCGTDIIKKYQMLLDFDPLKKGSVSSLVYISQLNSIKQDDNMSLDQYFKQINIIRGHLIHINDPPTESQLITSAITGIARHWLELANSISKQCGDKFDVFVSKMLSYEQLQHAYDLRLGNNSVMHNSNLKSTDDTTTISALVSNLNANLTKFNLTGILAKSIIIAN
jgi:hypothetical protein